MRIPSGTTNRYMYFVAVDATDLKTRETGLSSFTVYRSRNGAASAAMTTPTINETDVTNMPGVYELLMDEDTTLDSGHDEQEMVLHITCSGMAPVTRVVEIYRPKGTEGNTIDVTSGGAVGIDWGNVENQSTSVALSGTTVATVTTTGTLTTYTGNTPQTGDSYARIGATGSGLTSLAPSATALSTAQWTNARAGYQDNINNANLLNVPSDPADASDIAAAFGTVNSTLATIAGYLDTEIAAILADTNELQTDWANGGRLDLILDARASQASVDTIDGNVDSILVDTAEIGPAGAGLTNVPWNASWDAEVQSEANDALVALHLDHLLAATYDPASKPGAADALLNELVESDGGVSRFTANALEEAPTGGGGSAPTVEEIRQELDDNSTKLAAILTDTAEIGAAGAGLSAIPWNAAWDAEVQSEAADALNAYDPPTNTEMVAAFTEIKGATWSSGTDTLESLRDRGDAAWVTNTAASIRTAIGLASANLDTQLADIPTVAEFEARTLVASAYFDPATDTVARVTLVDTVTANTDMVDITGLAEKTDLPANFADMGITADGYVSRVVLVDTTTTNADMRGTNNAALAATALSTATWTGTRAGYLDKLNVTGTLANTDNANTFKADVSGLATSVAVAALPTLAQILAGGDIDGFTLEKSLKLILAACVGELSGAETSTVLIRAADDSKVRVTAMVDENGNRTALTLDGDG